MYVLCKHIFLFWMRLITINRLTALQRMENELGQK